MRYVHTNLVFRLQRPLGEAMLEEINERFSDILVKGRFVMSEPLPEEHEESELAALPRLVFHFDRHGFGRLRQLIDCINRGTRDEGRGTRDEG